MNYSRLLALAGVMLSISMFRLLPHPPNFTPVLAVALFAGAQITDRRAAILVPLFAMVSTDFILGMHATLPFVYGSITLIVLMGMWLRSRLSFTRIAFTTVGGSLLFFIITNFGAWLMLPELYARSADGLIMAYIAAIPFYQNALAADMLFVAILFGGFYLMERKYPSLADSHAV